MRGLGMQRLIVGLLAVGGFAVGCSEPEPFICQEDRSCSAGGRCVADYCAFEDRSCDSTLRYGEHAAAGLAQQCVVLTDAETEVAMEPFEGEDEAGSSTGWWDGSSGGDESSDSGDTPQTCVEQSCGGCRDCMTNKDEACSNIDDQCFFEAGCYAASICMELCFEDAACINDCCAEASPEAIELALAVQTCTLDACAAAGCEGEAPSCAPG